MKYYLKKSIRLKKSKKNLKRSKNSKKSLYSKNKKKIIRKSQSKKENQEVDHQLIDFMEKVVCYLHLILVILNH